MRLLPLVINRIPGLKWNEKLELLKIVNSVSELSTLNSDGISFLIKRPLKKFFSMNNIVSLAKEDLLNIDKKNLGIIKLSDPDYPELLKQIYDPPFIIFYNGNKSVLNNTKLSVVGTRYPTERAKRAAFDIGYECGVNSVTVVSGLARGIDRSAHLGNVKGRGETIAVLGSGIDNITPKSSLKAAELILNNNGLIISEYPPGMEARKYYYPARNRIISGLSNAVLLIQAPLKSGALITADYALEQGRELIVHSLGLASPKGKGGRKLVVEGAKRIDSLNDIFNNLSSIFTKGGENIKSNKIGYKMANNLFDELREGACSKYAC